MFFYIYLALQATLALVYALIIARYIRGWNQLDDWQIPVHFHPKTAISILIPARDEEANIEACLKSILAQNYPKELFEVIVIDDHSEDITPDIVQRYSDQNVKLLSLKDYLKRTGESGAAFKKAALEYGIETASATLIVTTDADCFAPANWLRHIAAFHELEAKDFIAAPVNFYKEKSLLERFQSLDFLGMMFVTGAGIKLRWMYMCNGANLAYTKTLFESVNGFEGLDHLASGDDMLLMHKVAASDPDKIGFLKSLQACIQTTAKPSLPSFIQQRLRWATKSSQYQDWKVTLVLAMVFFFCCSILLNLLLIPFLGFPILLLFLAQLMVKSLVDYVFLGKASQYFNRQDLMRSFWPSQFLHIAYIIGIGLWSNVQKQYTWKGRRVR